MTRTITSLSIDAVDPNAGAECYQITVDLPLSTVPFFTALRDGLKICGPFAASTVAGVSCEIHDHFDTDEPEFSSAIYFEMMDTICGAERHENGITLRMTCYKQFEGLDRLDYAPREDLPDNFWIEPGDGDP